MSARNTDNTVAEKTAIIHNIGANACGGVAYFWKGKPQPGDVLSADKVQYVDGTQAKPGDSVICGCCGHYLSLFDVNGVG